MTEDAAIDASASINPGDIEVIGSTEGESNCIVKELLVVKSGWFGKDEIVNLVIYPFVSAVVPPTINL